VQAVLDPVVIPGNGGATQKWYWRSYTPDPIRGEPFYFRPNPSAAWGHTSLNDGSRNLSMRLWGTRTLVSPPAITQISADTLAQAGRLKITGTNFGATQGTSTVIINGALAIIGYWSDTAITAYISDASAIGAGDVRVVTPGGTSNLKPFTVVAFSGGRFLYTGPAGHRLGRHDICSRGRGTSIRAYTGWGFEMDLSRKFDGCSIGEYRYGRYRLFRRV
jgi:hypothetical protein